MGFDCGFETSDCIEWALEAVSSGIGEVRVG